MALTIDPEFADQIPPLTDEEYQQLEENIIAEGAVINPLIVWDGVIVDGHNRYRILQKHPEIPFQIHEKAFLDRYEVIAWICKNQLGRRNLTPIQYKYLVGKQYEAEKKMRGGDRRSDIVKSNGQNDRLKMPEATSERIAREIGKGEKYVRRAGAFARGIDAAEATVPGIKQEIFSGEIHPPDKDIIAVAQATPEDRLVIVKNLRNPSSSTQHISNQQEKAKTTLQKPVKKSPTDLASIQEISEKMDSDSIHPRVAIDTRFIICELKDALESMMFRWETCLSDYEEQAAAKDCQKKIKELAQEGTLFLQQYREGEKQHEKI